MGQCAMTKLKVKDLESEHQKSSQQHVKTFSGLTVCRFKMDEVDYKYIFT